MKKVASLFLFISLSLQAGSIETESSDDLLDGFDEAPIKVKIKTKSKITSGLTGAISQQITFAPNDTKPHKNVNSLKTSLFLDFEHKFDNNFKFKTTAKAYYDAIYKLKGKSKFTEDELDELESEVELYDFYLEGSLADNLDMKVGRQVVVWGRSDTIRITDVLNPLDNRRPGMVDIEDLRLPITMAKFDYFIDNWRITPIAVMEHRFTKNPPMGSTFNETSQKIPNGEKYSGIAPALSIGAEFSNWDINIYAAKIQQDKSNMLGTAINILKGSWLLKSELAYFDRKINNQTDALIGVEYNGIANSIFSYDASLRHIQNKDNIYQHAFRASSDFLNASLKGNYLISLFGSKLDEGGFHRAWFDYDIADGVSASLGLVNYIDGSNMFKAIKDNDMMFLDVSYAF